MKKVINDENYIKTERLIKENSKLKLDELLKKYNTSLEGISAAEVEDRIDFTDDFVLQGSRVSIGWTEL